MTAVYVIAEAGVNHNGSVDLALRLVDAAADAGADAVKFQTFDAAKLVTATGRMAAYQVERVGGSGRQLDMLRALELGHDEHRRLLRHASERSIEFLSSPFDVESATFLIDDLALTTIKLGSGELTNGPLLYHVARSGRAVILSTGMATLEEIDEALGVLGHGFALKRPPRRRADLAGSWRRNDIHAVLREKVTLLHCTTAYPCAPEDANLLALELLTEEFDLPVGYSDHSQGSGVAIAAAALGAVVVEKHLTVDRSLPGPDHAASAEPGEFASMVDGIRVAAAARGQRRKARLPSEEANVMAARKSLVALADVAAGDTFTDRNLTTKRPGTGRSPMDFWDVLGTRAPVRLVDDEPVP